MPRLTHWPLHPNCSNWWAMARHLPRLTEKVVFALDHGAESKGALSMLQPKSRLVNMEGVPCRFRCNGQAPAKAHGGGNLCAGPWAAIEGRSEHATAEVTCYGYDSRHAGAPPCHLKA